MPSEQEQDAAAACPVDHTTREAWLKEARKSQSRSQAKAPPAPHAALKTPGCDSSQIDQSSTQTSSSILSRTRLNTDREISSIPRAASSPPDPTTTAVPANAERDTGRDAKTGNWIYPSEQMFFAAMKRKSYNPDETDMRTIVPIHNAVNERAWHEIKAWEAGQGSESCGGPKLASFSGLAGTLTPRARWNTLLGYQAPFDRHDWVVDRCGKRVEYVIDFYSGKEGQAGKPEGLSFYLDVRPKLNSWEGWRMRALRFVGM